jgi:hypothetical protein
VREYGPGHPLVFSHIPKTAGSSVRVALTEALHPAVAVHGVDCSLLAGYDDLDSVHPAMRPFMSPDELPADADLVAGHIGPATTMARYPGADHITVLRIPQLRVISQWFHGRSLSEFDIRHWGPSATAFRVARLPLADYLDHRMLAPNVDNTITRFLAWPHPLLSRTEFLDERHDDELFAAAQARLDRFGFVTVAEDPGFMDALSAWLGRPLPAVRTNERTAVPPRRRPDLAAELSSGTRALLDHRTRIDARLWTRAAAIALPGADPAQLLEEHIDAAVQRYTAMLTLPSAPLTKRRVVEIVYGGIVGLDPRRRAGRINRPRATSGQD